MTRPRLHANIMKEIMMGKFNLKKAKGHLTIERPSKDVIRVSIRDEKNKPLMTICDCEVLVGNTLDIHDLHRAFEITVS